MNIVFMGTPGIAATILEKLWEAEVKPVLVVTQTAKPQGRGQIIQPSEVEKMATQLGLSVHSTDNINSEPSFSILQKTHSDLILVVAFGQILKENVLSLPRISCLNVHASLLPKYRGAAPIQRAIWNGDKITGITIQKIAKKLDTGDILLQKEIEILASETSGELLTRLSQLGADALLESIQKIKTGKDIYTVQDESNATYAKKIAKEDALIDWTQNANAINNQIKALQPWPIAETILGESRFKIFKALVKTDSSSLKPAEIDTDGKKHLIVGCGENSALSLTEIQPENKKRLKITEFLSAFKGNFPFKKIGKP